MYLVHLPSLLWVDAKDFGQVQFEDSGAWRYTRRLHSSLSYLLLTGSAWRKTLVSTKVAQDPKGFVDL